MTKPNYLPRLSALMAVAAVAALLLLVVTAARPAGAAFAGENGKLVFVRGADNNSEIYVMDGDGSGQTRLTNNLSFDTLPAFSPDGRHVAFTSRRDSVGSQVNDEIYLMDAADRDEDGNGDNLKRLTNSLVNEFQPAFSPDGDRIAFTSNQTGNNEIYVMNADGTNQIQLTNNLARDARPAFAPDGNRLAFTSNRTGNDEIYVMDAAGGDGNDDNLVRLTNNPTADTFANFSPDGKDVAFTSRRDGNDEIYVVSSDGTGVPIRRTNNPATDEFPAFSPDGEKIAFNRRDPTSPDLSMRADDIYVMNADGSGTPTRLTNNLAPDSKPDWGPLPDTTPPDITLTTPADGMAYTLGQQVNAEYSCQDEMGGSGLASCVGSVPNGAPIDTATVGPKTFTVEATDNDGNTATRSHAYNVLYDFVGFYEPVNNLPTTNTAKAGRAIPVKFSLGGDQGLDIFTADYPRSGIIPVDPGAPLDDIEQIETAGASSLTYDPATGQYTYVWKTNKRWAGQTRQLVLEFKDGSEYKANFELH